jgi:DNA-directed RNA polymerase specialized sigma subunit
VERYRPGEGACFKSFAFKYISGAALTAIRNYGPYSRKVFKKLKDELAAKNKGEPVEGIPCPKLYHAQIKEHANEHTHATMGENLLADPSPGPESSLDGRDMIEYMLKRFTRREKFIFLCYHGGETMKATGEAAGISESMVSILLSQMRPVLNIRAREVRKTI